jgi:hypothetical protein
VLTISPAKDPQLQADSLLEITLKADYLTSKIGVHLNNISLSRFLQATQNHPDSLKELFEQVKYKAISTQTQADIVLLRKIAKSMLGQEDDQSIHLLQQDIKHKYRDIKNPQVKQALEQATDHFFNQQETSFTIVAQEALDNEQLIKTFMLFMIASNDAKIINKLLEKFTISNEANL